MNVTTVLKTPANLLAGNERTGRRGGKEGGADRQGELERGGDGKGEKEERELMHSRKGVGGRVGEG